MTGATSRRARVLLVALGCLVAIATSALAQQARDPGIKSGFDAADRAFERGWRSGEAASQRRHELELQRRQFEHERFLQWEQDAMRRGPSRNQKFNEAVSTCAARLNSRAYTWDANGRPEFTSWGPLGAPMNECVQEESR